MGRKYGNCEPIRRPIGLRQIARALVFLACVAGGVALMLQFGPWVDPVARDPALANGVFAGSLVGFMAAAQVRSGR
jgi:hypothetical protein